MADEASVSNGGRSGVDLGGAAEPRPRSFWPREHGAYAEIGLPLLSAVVLGARNAAPLLWIVAAVLLFLAHEPMLVAIGSRGRRARREFGPRAAGRVYLLLCASAVAGAAGWILTGAAARGWTALPLGAALAVAPLTARGKEKTLGGELLLALAFAGSLVPIALSGGVGIGNAAPAAAIWFGVFAAATVTVHAIKARSKRRPDAARLSRLALLLALGLSLLSAAAGWTGAIPAAAAAAPLPPLLAAGGFALFPIPARRLKRFGWLLAGGQMATLILLGIGLR